ncbi:sensor histidine kinase [Maribellus comscasis]|nr:HAMP domain-containing sensor histidine kinase [Maribellus comscasis]
MRTLHRIFLGFLVVIVIIMITNINALMSNRGIIACTEDIEHSIQMELIQTYKVTYTIQKIKSCQRELTFELFREKRKDEIIKAKQEIQKSITELHSVLYSLNNNQHGNYTAIEENENCRKISQRIVLLDSLNILTTEFISGVKTTLQLQNQEQISRAENSFEHSVEPVSRKIQELILLFSRNIEEEAFSALKALNIRMKKSLKLEIYIFVLSIILTLLVGIYITQSICKSLKQLTNGIQAITEGNLDTVIKLKKPGEFKEIADSFNEMTIRLKSRISAINKLNSDLEELNQNKDKYFSVIAHDLRNPFCSILGLTELLEERYHEFSTEEKQCIISELNSASKNVFNLLENLLTWSRAQTNRIDFHFKNLCLNSIIENCIITNKANANHKQISITNSISEKIYFHGDQFSITVVINNILSNAIKFTHDQGSVSIRAKKTEKEVEVNIKDTGIGLDTEILTFLSQSTKIGSKPGTKNEEGTGLGLLLVKEFVEKNKGRVTVNSVIGKGTEFNIYLRNETKALL